MTKWSRGQSQPVEPSHAEIYQRIENMNEDLQSVKQDAGKIYDTLHNIDRSIIKLESVIDERGRQLVATEQTLITQGKDISDLKTQVHTLTEKNRQLVATEQTLINNGKEISDLKTQVYTLAEKGRQSGSIFKDYIFPVLLCVIPFAAMSIMGLMIFQAKVESTLPGPAMEQRRQ